MALVTQDEAYPGQGRILADVQQAIRHGDSDTAEELRELDVALARAEIFGHSWHKTPEVVRRRGVDYWPIISSIYQDIPEYISAPAGERHRSRQLREKVKHWGVAVGLVLALGGAGWIARGNEVQAREGAVEAAEADLDRFWADQAAMWNRISDRQLEEAPPAENVPIYHLPDEEIRNARRQDHDNRD